MTNNTALKSKLPSCAGQHVEQGNQIREGYLKRKKDTIDYPQRKQKRIGIRKLTSV